MVLDEPVAALDLSAQAHVLNLFKELQRDMGMAYLFITHDLSVAEFMADRILVMYAGKLMELGDRKSLFESPRHPYTEALLSAAVLGSWGDAVRETILEGDPPSPISPPSGCRFHPRCPLRGVGLHVGRALAGPTRQRPGGSLSPADGSARPNHRRAGIVAAAPEHDGTAVAERRKSGAGAGIFTRTTGLCCTSPKLGRDPRDRSTGSPPSRPSGRIAGWTLDREIPGDPPERAHGENGRCASSGWETSPGMT